MTSFVLVIVTSLACLLGWAGLERVALMHPGRRIIAAPVLVLAVAAAIARLFGSRVEGNLYTVQALFAVVAAIAGGAVVATAVFEHIDAASHEAPSDGMQAAGQVLRGGAWIGALERAAVFGTVAAGWMEGIAIILAIKALGRYPELRGVTTGLASPSGQPVAPNDAGPPASPATERFIIGTMVSLMWAGLAAYIGLG